MRTLLSLLLLTLAPLAIQGAATNYIVQLSSESDPDVVMRFHGVGPKLHPNNGRAVWKRALKGWAGPLSANQLARLQSDTRVLTVELDLPVTNLTQTVPLGVRRIGCQSNTTWLASSTIPVNAHVAILDTGIDLTNTDFNIYNATTYVTGTTTAADDNGHGTHVAGIIGAKNNTTGVVGVAPGCNLWIAKVLGADGGGSTSDIISAINYMTLHSDQVEVCNMSLGGHSDATLYSDSQALRAAIQGSVAAGIVYVVAAGNDDQEIYGFDRTLGTIDDYFPAAYPEVMTVSAMADTDGKPGGLGQNFYTSAGAFYCYDEQLAPFSNWSGAVDASNPVYSPGKAIDVAAPGVNIYSTVPVGTCKYCSATGFAYLSGTSQAAPHVAGAVALYCASVGRAVDAAGVYAIRQWFINNAEPQNQWGINPTTISSNDTGPEGLVSVLKVGQSWAPTGSSPVVAITTPTNNASYTSITAITFAGTATDAEDGVISSSLVWNSSIQGQIGTGATFSRTLTNGNHTITAQAIDSNGNLGFKAIGIIVTGSGDSPPVLTITAPTNNAVLPNPSSITFRGIATDSEDGTISANIKWYYRGSLMGTGTTFGPMLWGGPNSYSVVATIQDSAFNVTTNQVNFSTSDSVPTPPPTTNNPPNIAISSPISSTVFNEGSPIVFVASANDQQDGDLTSSIVWTDSVAGSLGTGGVVTNASLAVGAHTVTASVSDSLNLTNSASITLSVTSTNPPPALPALSVAVTTDATSYVNKQKARITATVTSSAVPVSGATVNFTLVGSNGRVLNKTGVLTTSSGIASYTQQINKSQLSSGTVRVSATATKTGYVSGYGTNSFNVR